MFVKIYKRLAVFLSVILVLGLFAGCGTEIEDDGKLHIVTDCFSAYDWTRAICGKDNSQVEITLLTDKGQDMHSYQPSVADVAKIYTSDLFIYVGGESDAWVEEVLARKEAKGVTGLRLFDCLSNLLTEEELPGIGANAEEEDEEEFDEHVWLSVNNSIGFTTAICEALIEVDSQNEAVYRKNATEYKAQLEKLAGEYEAFFGNLTDGTMIVCDRFPFRYMVEDYNISYYAAFPGCSAETEASFATITFLSDCLKKSKYKCVFVLENSDESIAKAVINNSDAAGTAQVYRLNSLQSTNLKTAGEDTNYINMMRENLETMKRAFGGN